MSTDIVEEPLSESYEFSDVQDTVIISLFANGVFEVKDIHLFIETDSLHVETPGKIFEEYFLIENFVVFFSLKANERWIFQLWDHVYSDQVDLSTSMNTAQTQTSIEIRLLKQQPRKIWPQLYSYGSTPITPQRDGQLSTYDDVHMLVDRQKYELSLKKVNTNFTETNQTFTSYIYIKQIRDCQIQFTETNFTAVFCSE